MIRNLRDNHSEPWVQTSDSIEHETDKEIERTVEIPPQPSNGVQEKQIRLPSNRLEQDLCLCQWLD